MRSALEHAVRRWGRLSFALAAAADGALNPWRRARRRRAPPLLIRGVEFPRPPRRAFDTPGYYRGRVLSKRYLSPGVAWPFPAVVAGPDPCTLRPPLVLATFHIGPLPALGALVQRLPGPAAIVTNRPGVPTRGAAVLSATGSEGQRVAAATEAARIVRSGGFALLLVDGVGNARVPITLFGHETSLAAGAFALARLAGAPVLPIAVRWQGMHVRFECGDLIPSAAAETMAASVAAWLEGYLYRNPGEFTRAIATLLRPDPVTGRPASAAGGYVYQR